uniref:Uncharacterized protein n=2 Tax=Cajanus cajan TaxID=3821 RepID=A0A151SC05_CAJCA|nr:hypothetical protein KK1_025670 [Cajanus cajan]
MLSRSDIAAASSTNWYSQPEALGVKSEESGGGGKGLLELNLSSPSSSYNWCSVPQTQGTMNTFEPRRVL